MGLWNPTVYDAYDMRIQFMDLPGEPGAEDEWRVMNPDSYTHIWDDDPIEWPPGILEDPPDPPIEPWMNPFIAFEKEDPDRMFNKDPDGGGPLMYGDSEQLLLKIPPGSPGGEIVVILDGCYPNHCYDPYEISHMKQDTNIPSVNDEDATRFECVVADWQVKNVPTDISSVSLYLPDILGSEDPWIELTEVEDWPPPQVFDPPSAYAEWLKFYQEFPTYDPDTLKKYETTDDDPLLNIGLVEPGEYPGIIVAESDDLDGHGHDTLYNAFDFVVRKGGSGGNPGMEGAQIVFSRFNEGHSDIYSCFIVNNIVKGPYLLTDGYHDAGEDIWSDQLEVCVNRQGTKVAFISTYDVWEGKITSDYDVYLMDLEYSGGEPVTKAPEDWRQITGVGTAEVLDERTPDFEPLGNFLAFAKEKGGQFHIWTVNTSIIGDTPDQLTFGYGSDEEPNYAMWSPAGQWLYFQSNRAGGGNYEIYGIDPTDPEGMGNTPTRYTYNSGFDGYPSSYPVSDEVVSWASDRYGNMEILMVDGYQVRRLTKNDATDTHPSFSPDGDWIAFMSDRNDHQFEVFRMDKEGGNLLRITFEDTPDIFPFYGNLP
jgi:hypothetical protein